MPEPTEPIAHRVTGKSYEELDAFWRTQKPIMEAQELAAPTVAAALMGLTVAEAGSRVEQESEQRGAPLHVEFKFSRGPQTAEYVYGRIRAFVQNGVVVAASAG